MADFALNKPVARNLTYKVAFQFLKRDDTSVVVFQFDDDGYKTVSAIEKRRRALQSLNNKYVVSIIIYSYE